MDLIISFQTSIRLIHDLLLQKDISGPHGVITKLKNLANAWKMAWPHNIWAALQETPLTNCKLFFSLFIKTKLLFNVDSGYLLF